MIIDAGASMTISSGGLLSTGGNFANSGTLTNNGTIKLNGNSNQSFPGNSGSINAMNILEVNSTSIVTINKSFDITTELRPTSGTLALDNFNITLKSTAGNTASVSAVGGAITYGTGQFIVERYISTGGRWQYLAVPTENASQTFNTAWQEGATYGTQDPTPGYGMHITGPAGVGFDDYTVRHSVKILNENTAPDGWDLLTGTNAKLDNYKYKGIMAFVRSNRALAPALATAGPTTLRSKGRLVTGTQIVNLSGEILGVGNPYASSIDLTQLSTSGLKNVIYVWDPTLGGAYGDGGYQTLTLQGSGYLVTPGGSAAYSAGSPNLVSSGQAFIVVTGNATSGTITFKETDKVTQNNLVTFGPERTQKLEATLRQPVQGQKILLDGMLTIFDAAADNSVDAGDAQKMKNPGDRNTGWSREGQLLSIERRQPVSSTDTLFIYLGVKTAQKYEWDFNFSNIPAEGQEAVLEDLFLQTKTTLKLNGSNNYSFDINEAAGSRAADRFRIILAQKLLRDKDAPIVNINNAVRSVSVYPNPVVNKQLQLKFTNKNAARYLLELTNLQGQVLYKTSLNVIQGDSFQGIRLPGRIAQGNYLLKITDPKGSSELLNVLL
jgi:hypothetical protein